MSDRPRLTEVMHAARSPLAVLGTMLGIAGLVLGGYYAWNRYSERYTVERTDDGAAVTRIVAARFAGASALKVGTLTGMVQATASDVRGFGILHSDKVVKAPFSVDYFIDVARLGQGDLAWNAASRGARLHPLLSLRPAPASVHHVSAGQFQHQASNHADRLCDVDMEFEYTESADLCLPDTSQRLVERGV